MEWRKRHHWRRRKRCLPYSLAPSFLSAIIERCDSAAYRYVSFTESNGYSIFGRRPKVSASSRAAFHGRTILVAICCILLVNHNFAAADASAIVNDTNITITTFSPTTSASNLTLSTVPPTIRLDEIYSTISTESYAENGSTQNYFSNVSESIKTNVSIASTTTGAITGSVADISSSSSTNTHYVESTTVIPPLPTENPSIVSSLTTLISAVATSTKEPSKNSSSTTNNGAEEFRSTTTAPVEASTTSSRTASVASSAETAATSDIPATQTSTPLSVTPSSEETTTTIVLHLNATAAVEFLEPAVRAALVGRLATTALQVIAPPASFNNSLEQDSNGNSTTLQSVDSAGNLSMIPAPSTETLTKLEEGERSKSDKFSLKNNKLKNKKPAIETDTPLTSKTTTSVSTTTMALSSESSTSTIVPNQSSDTTEDNTKLSSTTPIISIPIVNNSPNPNQRQNKRIRPKKGRKQPQPVEMLFEINSMADLREYKSQLLDLVSRVDKALDIQKSADLRNNFVPIQATHPDQLSAQFLRRVGAALNVSPNVDEKDELERRLAPKSQLFMQSNQIERTSRPLNNADVTGDTTSVPRRTPQHNLQSLSSGSGSGYDTTEAEGESERDANYKKLESMLMTAVLSLVTSASERRFMPVVNFAGDQKNHTVDECKRFSQSELVSELKQHGTYNPDLMAWDVSGVFRFLDRSISDQYERQSKSHTSSELSMRRNIEALERLLTELNLQCNVSSPEVIARLSNLTLAEPRRSIISPSIRMTDDEIRYKRNIIVAEDLMQSFNRSRRRDDFGFLKKQRVVGEVHLVPFGCDKRGGEEDGYLRLCSACQAVRRLPDEFFPPFINEVVCDEDKACLYFYDYPHGKCKQKHMNFVVLKNMGTQECQVWQKVNLNVRVSCECFVDEMSFFAKYV